MRQPDRLALWPRTTPSGAFATFVLSLRCTGGAKTATVHARRAVYQSRRMSIADTAEEAAPALGPWPRCVRSTFRLMISPNGSNSGRRSRSVASFGTCRCARQREMCRAASCRASVPHRASARLQSIRLEALQPDMQHTSIFVEGPFLTCPTKSFLGAMAGSGGSPGRIRFGLANDTTSGLLPLRRVRPLCASCAASAAAQAARSVRVCTWLYPVHDLSEAEQRCTMRMILLFPCQGLPTRIRSEHCDSNTATARRQSPMPHDHTGMLLSTTASGSATPDSSLPKAANVLRMQRIDQIGRQMATARQSAPSNGISL
jgi:hypothetical protein